MFEPMLCANWRSVVECDFEEDGLHNDHKAGLKEEGATVVCAEPVEDSE